MEQSSHLGSALTDSAGHRVFFGAGGGGAAYLENTGSLPAWFVDNDPTRHSRFLSGVPIKAPSSLLGAKNFTVVVTTGHAVEVIVQLKAMGFSDSQIVVPPKATLGKQVLRDPRNRDQAISSVARLTESLMPLGKLVVVGGACLGLTRSRDLIPWDLDVDVAFPLSKVKKVIECTESVVELHEEADGRLVGSFELVDGDKLPVSFQFFDSDSRYYRDDQFLPGHVWRWPMKMFSFPLELSIMGCRFFVPNPPHKYLEQVYGKDWRVSREDFSFMDYGKNSS